MWSTLSNNDTTLGSIEQQKHSSRILIIGPKRAGKTSIAFRMAYEVACEGSTVLFVCLQNTINNTFPSLVSLSRSFDERLDSPSILREESNGTSWSPAALSRIMFKYVTNTTEMKKIFASIHLMQPRPQCIVVDDYTLVIDPMSTVSRQDSSFLDVSQVLGSFIDDAVDYLDKAANLYAISRNQPNPLDTKLIITSDCVDSSFVNLMLRYASCALILLPILEPSLGRMGSSSSNTHADKGVKATVRREISTLGSEDKIVFSSIKFIDGRLICTR